MTMAARAGAFGLWLVAGWVPVQSSAAPPPTVTSEAPSPSSKSALEFWVEPGLDAERGWLDELGNTIFGEPTPLHENLVRLTLWGEPYDYRIRIELARRGQLLTDQPEELVCKCGSDEMLARVGDALVAGAERLAQAERDEDAATQATAFDAVVPAEAVPEPQAVPVEQRPPEVASEPRRRLGALGKVGIAGMTLGAVLMAGGIPFAVSGNAYHREPGIGFAVGGGVVFAVGVTWLAVDVARARKRSVAVMPILAPRQIGIAWTRRF